MNEFTISDFPHTAPKGYYYEHEQFNSRLISIWLHFSGQFSYNNNKPIRTIWGFYSPKKGEYYAPINSSKCGDRVNILETTPYTAMQIKLTPLERCFS